MSATVRDLLLRRADDHHPALLFEELRWSWQEYVEHAARTCHAMAGAVRDRPSPARRGPARQRPRDGRAPGCARRARHGVLPPPVTAAPVTAQLTGLGRDPAR